MRKKKQLIILSIISTVQSFAFLLLYFVLFYPEHLSSLFDFESTSESLMVYACIITAAISLLIEIVLFILSRKEKRLHRAMMETILLYSMMSNKGEDYYHNRISRLVEEEMLTVKEQKKLEILHEKIAKDTEDATLEEMKESIDGLLISMDLYAHH